MQTEYVKYAPKETKISAVPITVEWNNSRMVRIHSIRAVAREILNLSENSDAIKINLIGAPSTGKTTLALLLMHLLHQLARIPFTVKILTRNDLLNFENVLKNLQPTNHILLFDDISFLTANAGKRQIERLQKAFSEIRHLEGGRDIKVITIFNFHYNMAVSKYLRQADYFFYTSIGSSELENTQKVVGVSHTKRLLDFRRIFQQAMTKHEFTFSLGKKGQKFTYKFRKPFAPVLFWNTDIARIVVFPKREWVTAKCSTCLKAVHEDIRANMDIKHFDDIMKHKFGIGIIRHAMKIKLFNMGLNTYPKRVKQCMSYLDEIMSKEVCNLEELAEYYALKDNRTRLDFKLPPDQAPPVSK